MWRVSPGFPCCSELYRVECPDILRPSKASLSLLPTATIACRAERMREKQSYMPPIERQKHALRTYWTSVVVLPVLAGCALLDALFTRRATHWLTLAIALVLLWWSVHMIRYRDEYVALARSQPGCQTSFWYGARFGPRVIIFNAVALFIIGLGWLVGTLLNW